MTRQIISTFKIKANVIRGIIVHLGEYIVLLACYQSTGQCLNYSRRKIKQL